jgi:hypothetical protein
MRTTTTSFLGLLILSLLFSGCGTTKYYTATPGVTSMGRMNVTIGTGWLRVSGADTPEKRSLSRVLTHDSVDSDRLMLIPGVSEGQSIFTSNSSELSLPLFSADMNSKRIADLVAMSMQLSLWDGQSTVTASNARDAGFTGISGFKFDLSVALPGGQSQKGMAGGFIDDDRLYVNIFVANSPEPFDEHESSAQQVIDSAVLTVKTIKRSAITESDAQLVVSRH